jgi:flagellar biosynthesis protein FlhF
MRMKSFFAPTMTEAMELVRFEMGAQSIIVATRDEKDGAVITAAIEDTTDNGLKKSEKLAPEELPDFNTADTVDVIRQSLSYHGLPVTLSERLAGSATDIIADTPTLALAAAMDEAFTFAPISSLLTSKAKIKNAPRVLIMGPPGAGKTITTAKLAALATLNKMPPQVITTDCKRAGGIEQLAAFTRILKIDLQSIEDADGLSKLLEGTTKDTPVLIDSQGTNPFDEQEMEHLKSLASVAGAENVLVLAAGGDALEAAEIAREFSRIGATRLVVTRLDMTRRLGSILAAADAGKLALSDVSINPDVVEGINPINPVSLARLIMPYTDNRPAGYSTMTGRNQTMTEATL